MKWSIGSKGFLLVLLLPLWNLAQSQTLAGGTYEVGSSRTYTNLTAVASVLSSDTVTGNVIFELMNDYDGTTGETFPIIFTLFTTSGGNWNVTIRPASGVSLRTTSGSVTGNPLINLNGVDRLTLDGRAGGSGSILSWLIRNTATSSAGWSIQFINDATQNTLQYLQLESQNILEGTVYFASTTGAAGNDNNTIAYCSIRDRSDVTGIPSCAIYSNGTSGKENSNNFIQNCDIFNIGQAGVYLYQYSTGWTISGNNFFSGLAGSSQIRVVWMADGNGYSINNNYIGGQAIACGGSAWTTGNDFYGIYLAQASGTSTTLQGNTIQNIEVSDASSDFYGMYFNGGTATTGTGNTIGDASTSNSIQLAGQTNAAIFINAGTITAANNLIAHITSTGTDNNTLLRGITGQLSTVIGNTIHHLSTASTKQFNIDGYTYASANAALMGIYTIANTAGQTIENNTIYDLSCTSSGTAYPALIAIGIDASTNTSGTIRQNHIYNFSNLSTGGTILPSIIGVRTFSNKGSWQMVNNMISLMNTSNTNNIRIYGIQEGGDSCWIYYNSILIGGSPSTGAAASAAVNVYHVLDAITSKNNILLNERSNSGSASGKHYALRKSANAALISDNNVLYANGTDGYIATDDSGTTNYTTISAWNIATGQDAHSQSKAVTFASSTDLHLSEGSIGDYDLEGTPLAGITTDYDGETRSIDHPYMGADENTSSPLPVQLTSFTAVINCCDALLNWRTATEVDNYGFEVERRSVTSDELRVTSWKKIGFVSGSGTSNSPKEYSFTDSKLPAGRYAYRLKQVDVDGLFKYSQSVEVEIGGVLKVFSLSQNYPNPFNPATTIEFTLAEDGLTTLKIYDVLGREVATLVKEELKAGVVHQVAFDASRFCSGIYFYQLESGSQTQVRKLLLMK